MDISRGSGSLEGSGRSESLDGLGCSEASISAGRSGSSGFWDEAEIMVGKGARWEVGYCLIRNVVFWFFVFVFELDEACRERLRLDLGERIRNGGKGKKKV